MCLYAQQILDLLFPNATSGAMILQISAFTIIFTILDQTINGALQGFGKVMVPATALGVGVFAKLILNLVLVPIPEIGVNGAAIGSVVCHMVAFTIAINVLRKNIKLDIGFKKFIVKPVIATFIMAICSYFVFMTLNNIIAEKMATLIAMAFGVIVYAVALVALKIFTEEEMKMIPYGKKIYEFLEKRGIY